MKKYFVLFLLFCAFIQLVIAQKIGPTEGQASFYSDGIHGKRTASGEKFDKTKYTAAHKTLPFGTLLKVTNLANGKTVVVRVNDRGPFVKGRILDVSKIAAKELGFVGQGVAKVRIEIVQEENKKEDIKEEQKTTDEGNVDKEIYQIHALKSFPEGYSVQVGTFKELINLMKLSEALGTKYKSQVFVEVAKLDNEKVYKVSVGKLLTKEEAESLKESIKNQYPDCFIVKF